MHTLSLRTLALQVIIGLASGAAVSIPARNASPEPASDMIPRHPEPAPAPAPGPLFTVVTPHEGAITERTTTRPVYNGTAAGGDDNYCGESAQVTETFGNDKPLAADCRVIASRYSDPVRGFFTVLPSDIGADGWVTLDSYRTCAFKTYLNDQPAPIPYRFGSNDIRFYITVYTRNEKNGHYAGESPVLCNWNHKFYGITWKIASP